MSDDHPFIIKMPDYDPQPENGLGYELFYGMKKNSEKVAQYIEHSGKEKTHGELLDRCTRVAFNLMRENLDEDDIIGACHWNHEDACIPYIASVFLCQKIVGLDPALPPDELALMLKAVTPKIIFVDESALDNLEESLVIANLQIKLVVVGKNAKTHLSFNEFLVASKTDVDKFEPIKAKSTMDTAMIFFSSGTNGVPKGIGLSHYAMLVATSGYYVPVSIIFAQINWVSNVMMLFRALRNGGAVVLMGDFNASKLWKVIQDYKVNLIFVKVYQIAEMLRSSIPPDVDISSLNVIVTGGAALPHAILLKTKAKLPQVTIVQGYGSTESATVALIYDLSKEEHRRWQIEKENSVGRPVQGLWYKVVDPETNQILGPNEPGELRLKSKAMMKGYYNTDSDVFDEYGWLKTGDIVKYDEDHCFFIIDRIKEMIKYQAWIISPSVLEKILLSHPAVNQAAVIGIPHLEDSEHAMGIVTLKEKCHADPEELEKYVEERVSKTQRLRAGVKVVKEMPMGSAGKILKRILKKKILNGELK